MEKKARIFVAGHNGLVGSGILRILAQQGYTNVLTKTRGELDLRDARAVSDWMCQERPEYVFLAAARVGGIHANDTYPAEFIRDNLLIESSVIHAAYESRVQRLLLLGSSCIYPKMAPQPLEERYFMSGPLEPTNRPYAIAKIAGIEMCWAYNRQYGTKFLAAMPTNLYGVGDNYHPINSHVIPGLLRRFHEAKVSGALSVTVWGTGNARREFLFNADAADACVFLMNLAESEFRALTSSVEIAPLINVGYGEDLNIRELAALIAEATDFAGAIVFDVTRPDGTPAKLLDSSRIRALGWKPAKDIRTGLKDAYQDFLSTDRPVVA